MPKGLKIEYSSKEIEWLFQKGDGKTHKEVYEEYCNKFKREDVDLIHFKRLRKRLGIKASGDGRFKKGSIPVNKGTKGIYNVGGNRTSFKKGHKTHNYRPVGSERITKDGYIKVKVADPNVWKLKHRLVYEEHHGPIPEGMYVAFLDQNPQNLEISNLILITKKESVRLNTNHYLQKRDGRINLAYIGLVKLQNKIREKGKRHGN